MGSNDSSKSKCEINNEQSLININYKEVDCDKYTDVKYNQYISMNDINKPKSDFRETSNDVKHRSRVTSRSANALFLLLRISMKFKVLVQQCMLFLILISSVSAYREQRFAIEPQDQVSHFSILFLVYLN